MRRVRVKSDEQEISIAELTRPDPRRPGHVLRRELNEEILGAVLQLHNTGQPITRRNIAAFLNKPKYKTTSKILDPIRRAKQHLGLI